MALEPSRPFETDEGIIPRVHGSTECGSCLAVGGGRSAQTNNDFDSVTGNPKDACTSARQLGRFKMSVVKIGVDCAMSGYDEASRVGLLRRRDKQCSQLLKMRTLRYALTPHRGCSGMVRSEPSDSSHLECPGDPEVGSHEIVGGTLAAAANALLNRAIRRAECHLHRSQEERCR